MALQWASFNAAREPRERDRLVFVLVPLVRAIVTLEVEKSSLSTIGTRLSVIGLNALVDAIESYDPRATDASLEDYVWCAVTAAVRDDSGRLHRDRRSRLRIVG